jgi:corrinoid protein of di/trimethylamine methyltransferase
MNEKSSLKILEKLKSTVIEYDAEGAKSWAEKAVEEHVDPIEAADALTEAIRQVGDGFGRGELFLVDLVSAAESMKNAMPIIQEEIKRRDAKQETMGTVVIGTVKGDIHDIGKTMVSTLLIAEGFEVIDLGVDVSAERFIKAIKEHKPNILAMSALLTTTAPEQEQVIEALESEDLREKVRIMIGGGSITKEFADSIGADGYDPTALGAANLARKLLGK